MDASSHPVRDLLEARAELLAALQGLSASDLLAPGVEGAWCGRDVLLHIAAWLRELARLVPDLARHGYQRGEAFDPGTDWSAWNEVQIEPHRQARPEAAVSGVVTAHVRLIEALAALDEATLQRRGPTRFGFEASAWELLLAEAEHEREHAARLALCGRTRRTLSPLEAPCHHQPGPLLRAS